MSHVKNALRISPVLVLLALLAGCAEYGYRLNELVGLNCRPAALQNGYCVAAKGGSK